MSAPVRRQVGAAIEGRRKALEAIAKRLEREAAERAETERAAIDAATAKAKQQWDKK